MGGILVATRWPFSARLLIVIAVLLAVAACQNRPVAGEFDGKGIVATGTTAVGHGRQMQELGARMVEHGQAINDQSWTADGQHWVVDGKRMVEIGEGAIKLGQSMRGNPVKAQEVDIDKVRIQGQGLIASGKSFLEHGAVMVELSDLLKRHAETSSDQRLAQDVADSADRAKRMSETGEYLLKSGQELVDFADTLARSIGR